MPDGREDAVNWQIGQTILNQFLVKQIFTAGGMGLVYRVYHTGWQIDLALKCPRPELLQSARAVASFEAECETWAELGLHPHIATCYYTRMIERTPCVFAEYVEGGSLRDWITSRKLYQGEEEAAVARMLTITVEFAWGLEWAHRHGLVHQDVKPGNVLLMADGTTKVTDFGLASILQSHASDGSQQAESTAAVRGLTPAYSSPEQARGDRVTKATDVWSWAVSVLEMFCGGITWHSGPAAHAALEEYKGRGLRAREMPQMPQQVYQLLVQCFAREPGNRPASFAAIADTMLAIYESLFGEPCEAQNPDIELLAADSLNNRAVSLLDIGRAAEAEALIRQALAVDSLHPEATFNLAAIRRLRKEPNDPRAIQNLRAAAGAEPGNPVPMKLLAQLLMLTGNRDEALRCFGEASQRAWNAAEKAEIAQLQRSGAGQQFVLARPRSGSEFCGDLVRFRRLMDKAEAAITGQRQADANRYTQMAREIPGFGRHPRLSRVLTRLKGPLV